MSATDGAKTQDLAVHADPPRAVIDTNVALDLLAFRDSRCGPLAEALESGAVRWLASAYMLNELDSVLSRAALQRYGFDRSAIRQALERLVVPSAEPTASRILRCRDPADQVFLDLALTSGARWLITHDRDLLSLARHAARRGLLILTPMAWSNG